MIYLISFKLLLITCRLLQTHPTVVIFSFIFPIVILRTLAPNNIVLKFIICREKKLSRLSAIKVLDHAMIGQEGADNCHKFVDILGLRSVFPLFMKTPKKHKKIGTNTDEMEGLHKFLPRLCSRKVKGLRKPIKVKYEFVHCFM